jgi:putative membrane protein
MTRLKQYLYFVFCGMTMGCADTIPGVSGGTMALITGIYHRLIGAIKSADISLLFLLLKGRIGDIWRQLDLGFLLCVLGGIVVAALFVIRVLDLPGLLHSYPSYVYALFFGLILGSVPLVIRRADGPKDRLSWLLCFAAGAALAFFIVTQRPAEMPEGMLYTFIGGAIAICAMLLPGISGSFLLLMTGQYLLILHAVKDLNFAVLLPFLAGCLVGVLSFSRLISWLLREYHNATLYFMGGLLAGSLWMIWPWQHREYLYEGGKEKLIASSPYLPQLSFSTEQLIIAVLAFTGLFVVLGIERMAKKMPG